MRKIIKRSLPRFPTEEITSNFGQQRCKKFNFSMEEGGFIKRGEGYACQNNKTGNWEMLGVRKCCD